MAEVAGDFNELFRRLETVKARAGVNAMRAAGRKAVRPTMILMKARMPKGSVPHRTYKGRLVAPGFASRNLRAITKINRQAGRVATIIGMRREAYYVTQYYDQGPYTITTRRRSVGGRKRVKLPVLPYTLHRRPWFQSVFISQRHNMEAAYAEHLKAEIEKAARI